MEVCELGREALRLDLEVVGGFGDAEFLGVESGDFGGMRGGRVRGEVFLVVVGEDGECAGEFCC